VSEHACERLHVPEDSKSVDYCIQLPSNKLYVTVGDVLLLYVTHRDGAVPWCQTLQRDPATKLTHASTNVGLLMCEGECLMTASHALI